MKDWFPLTSYDFYAYLTAGMVALAAIDRVFLGSMLAGHKDWTIVAGVFWAAIGYLLGQIIAIPSSVIVEHVLGRLWLRPPSAIILGFEQPRWREIAMRWGLGAREYAPMPEAVRASIVRKAAAALSVDVDKIDGETAFTHAFPRVRAITDTATRLDNFINQYGMARNVSFASLLACVMLTYGALHTSDRLDGILAVAALVLAVGLFGRFVKFYAAYSREVFRTYDNCVQAPAVALAAAPASPSPQP